MRVSFLVDNDRPVFKGDSLVGDSLVGDSLVGDSLVGENYPELDKSID